MLRSVVSYCNMYIVVVQPFAFLANQLPDGTQSAVLKSLSYLMLVMLMFCQVSTGYLLFLVLKDPTWVWCRKSFDFSEFGVQIYYCSGDWSYVWWCQWIMILVCNTVMLAIWGGN